MKKYFWLLLLPVVLGLTACSKDNDETSETVINPQDLEGRWLTNGSINGQSAYSLLHLNSDGTGRSVFFNGDADNPTVSYSDVNYTLKDDVITFDIASLPDEYKITIENNKIILSIEKIKKKIQFTKDKYDASILTQYQWVMKSSLGVLNWDFETSGEGSMKVSVAGQETSTTKPFNYTVDYDNGPMNIKYSDGSSTDFFYTAYFPGYFLMFAKNTENSQIGTMCLKQSNPK